MKYLIIILACLSLWPKSGIGQDLEHIIQPKPVPQVTSEADSIEEDDLSSLMNVSEKNELEKSPVTKERDPTTYRKEEYINTLLRHTYYQRLLTPGWAKYISPESWKENFTKWRYWVQLKNYLAKNDANIIVLRTPSNPPQVDSLVAQDLFPEEDSLNAIESTVDTDTKPSIVNTDQLVVQTEEIELSPPTVQETPPLQEKITENPSRTSSKEDPEPKVTSPPPTVPESKLNTEPIPKKTEPPVQKDPEIDEVKKDIPPLEKKPDSEPLSRLNAPFNEMKGRLPWPVKNGKVTDRFGFRKNAEERGLRPENYGVDMLCPPGTTVTAVHDGVVLMAKRQSPYDYIVTVKHGQFTTAHYFLINPYVQPGDEVRRGQALGQLRTSVAEADFHFEIWNNQDRMNPELWLEKK